MTKIMNLLLQSVGEQHEPNPDLDIRSDSSSNADTKAFTGATLSQKKSVFRVLFR